MNYKNLITTVLIFSFIKFTIYSQSRAVNRDKYRIHITYTEEKIVIDGLLNENVWKIAEKVNHFQRVTPTDTGYAIAQTEVMVAYDKLNLYVGAICYDPTPGKRPIQSLRRDFTFMGNDNFALFLNPYNDQTNGFGFYVSAAGAQYDHLGYDGNKFDVTWDTKWKSAVKSYDDRWVIEMCIPFRSLRYIEGYTEWGINFGRLDLKTNEKSAWAPMPRQFNHCDLAYTGTLVWDKPVIKASGLGFSLIPYITGKVIERNQPEEKTKWDNGLGTDAKVMLSTSMNLDITINPDYSQIEEDRQQTNLERFELFFPERRQYFLENSDLFANLGTSNIRPFFSRRIGLNVPVFGGIKLSGKLGNNWRVGLMDIQTGEKDIIPASNFGVMTLQRKVFSRSYITGFLINKEITGNYNDSLYNGFNYNRTVGLEYNLASYDNKWTGKAFYHKSFYPGSSGDDAAIAGNLTFSTRYFKASLNSAWIGANYIAEVGYIRRKGYFEINPTLKYTFYPSGSFILSHGPSITFDVITDPSFGLTDRETLLDYTIGFQDRSQISIDVAKDYILLDRNYDPTNTGGETLPAGDSFNWVNARIGYTSDSRKLFNYSISAGYGNYYNGTKLNFNGTVTYRFQPYGSVSISANYNNIKLPDPYNSAELVLIGPRIDITFTDKIFLTTFVQYNNQIDNLNTNIRFQWRFAPVSDFFIVYTGNSFTGNFENKDRGLVVKLTYWFN